MDKPACFLALRKNSANGERNRFPSTAGSAKMMRSECGYHCRKASFFILPFQPSKPGSFGFVQTTCESMLKFFENSTSSRADIEVSQKQNNEPLERRTRRHSTAY